MVAGDTQQRLASTCSPLGSWSSGYSVARWMPSLGGPHLTLPLPPETASAAACHFEGN